jgi:hypothetical protein
MRVKAAAMLVVGMMALWALALAVVPAQAQGADDGAANPPTAAAPRPMHGRGKVAPSAKKRDALPFNEGARGDGEDSLQERCPDRGGKLELIV